MSPLLTKSCLVIVLCITQHSDATAPQMCDNSTAFGFSASSCASYLEPWDINGYYYYSYFDPDYQWIPEISAPLFDPTIDTANIGDSLYYWIGCHETETIFWLHIAASYPTTSVDVNLPPTLLFGQKPTYFVQLFGCIYPCSTNPWLPMGPMVACSVTYDDLGNNTVDPTTPNPTTSDSDPTTSDPTTSDPTTSNPTTSDPTTSDPTTSNLTTKTPMIFTTKTIVPSSENTDTTTLPTTLQTSDVTTTTTTDSVTTSVTWTDISTASTKATKCEDDLSLENSGCSDNGCSRNMPYLEFSLSFSACNKQPFVGNRYGLWNAIVECLCELSENGNIDYSTLDNRGDNVCNLNVVKYGMDSLQTPLSQSTSCDSFGYRFHFGIEGCGDCVRIIQTLNRMNEMQYAEIINAMSLCANWFAKRADMIGFGDVEDVDFNIQQEIGEKCDHLTGSANIIKLCHYVLIVIISLMF